jgi:hypothetical protein
MYVVLWFRACVRGLSSSKSKKQIANSTKATNTIKQQQHRSNKKATNKQNKKATNKQNNKKRNKKATNKTKQQRTDNILNHVFDGGFDQAARSVSTSSSARA